jgi:hypothetical protein
MILIYPPVAKLSEPPAGLAKIVGTLNHHDVKCRVVDTNLEGILHLLNLPQAPTDTWTKRAVRNLASNIASLKHRQTYQNPDRYKRVVADVNRVLAMSARPSGVYMSLANYKDQELSPVRSADLIRASEIPEENPFYPYFRKRLVALLEKEQPSIVGFSLNYMSQALCTFAMAGFLRRICPCIKIVLGGGLVTSWMRKPGWQNPFRDVVDDLVAGPGEDPLLSILGKEPSENYDTPDYGIFNENDYMSPGFILPYSASSGCYWNRCSFCPEKAEGNPYCPVPSIQVVADIHSLIRKEKPALLHFLDNALSPVLLGALIKNPPGVPWYGFVRISHQLTNPDFCRALKQSGCAMLKLGLESGNQKVLDELQKGINLEEASLALKSLKDAGIGTYIYLLFGTPAENLTEARQTLEFTVQHSDEIDFLNLAVFNLPAYGPDTEKLETTDFYEGDLSLYRQFSHPKGWDRKIIRQFLDREFKRHPAIASIIRRNPPLFTSNHAPFFVRKEVI